MSRKQRTFDPDVAVPLEVVVGSFPGVPVVPQKRDRRSRPDRYITHSFLIWTTKTSVEQVMVQTHYHHHCDKGRHCITYQHIPLVEIPVAQPGQ